MRMPKFYEDKPKNFLLKVEVSTVFMESDNKLLLLQRAPHKISGGKWAIPGGKLEDGETPLEGLIREIQEEVQLSPPPEVLTYIKSFYVRHPLLDYKLHLFIWKLNCIPKIMINLQEHQSFLWQRIDEFNNLILLEGQIDAFYSVYRSKELFRDDRS